MSPADYQAMRRSRPRGHKGRSKYGNAKVQIDGMRFDSRFEYERWCELRILENAGAISDLRRQVSIDLMGRDGPLKAKGGRRLRYVADFIYVEDGREVVEDAKGAETAVYKLKRAILAAQGVEIREVRRR